MRPGEVLDQKAALTRQAATYGGRDNHQTPKGLETHLRGLDRSKLDPVLLSHTKTIVALCFLCFLSAKIPSSCKGNAPNNNSSCSIIAQSILSALFQPQSVTRLPPATCRASARLVCDHYRTDHWLNSQLHLHPPQI